MRTKSFTIAALVFVATLTLFALPSASPAAAQACSALHTTDMATWDMYTGTQGHYELVDGGLRVWTESNTGNDVVQGSRTLDVPFSTITSASIDYTATLGTIPPGIFIFMDTDGDGNWNGVIIGEASYYGANWWLSSISDQNMKDHAPHNGGGYGSPWYGTLAEWNTAFPTTQVVWIGFSLGSGVLGDGVITSMTFGCHVYTFGLPGAPVPEAALPPVAGFTCRAMVAAPLTGPLYAEALLGQEWAAWKGFVVQDLDKQGGIEVSLHHHDGEYNSYEAYRVIGNNGGEVLYLHVTDLPGICAEVSDPLAGDS